MYIENPNKSTKKLLINEFNTCISQSSQEKQDQRGGEGAEERRGEKREDRTKRRKIEIYEKLTHTIVGTDKSKICKTGQQGRVNVAVLSQGSLEAEFLPPWETSVFFFQVFNWLDEAVHMVEGNPLYSKSTDLNINNI